MATKEDQNNNSTSGATTNSVTKGLVKDYNDSYVGEGLWTHARNTVNNSHDGQLGTLSNEPSNIHCVNLPYTLIGAVSLVDDEWAIFTTDDTDSEIGIFDESKCEYRTVVNNRCLGFKRSHLITGTYRDTFDCGRKVYFGEGLNPDRCINIDNPPFVKKRTKQGDCIIETNTTELDCEQLRLAPLLTIPKLTLKKAKGSGTLPNGSYQATIAYTVNQIRVTDYLVLSEVQPLFNHLNVSGSLELRLENLDIDFDEFELVIISTINQQTVAKRIGTYSTHDSSIYIDTIDPSLVTIPLSQIPLRTPAIEKSDSIYQVNNYLLRVGIYAKPDFNYQPQANKIRAKWVSVQYPADYYHKGGNHASYMRDEQYAFFIRWVYNTGDKSASYHIPGRAAKASDLINITGADAIELQDDVIPKAWQVYNTATATAFPNESLEDGGIIIAEGEMGYWESTEKYPDTQPEIWGSLCGEKIRHHKFPDNTVASQANHFSQGGENIHVLGVKFEGITPPLDNAGNPIQSIVGYEILRGSREGQKTIIAKGLLNNMREYAVPGDPSQQGLFQNYPFNDLRADYFLTSDKNLIKKGGTNGGGSPLTGYKKNVFSFHSPETSFSRPFLASNELKIYQENTGLSLGSFEVPYKHPKVKALTNFTSVLGSIVGVMTAAGVVSNGIQIAATEDIPVTLQVGPVSGPPSPPTGAPLAGLGQAIVAYVSYAASLAVWGASIAQVVVMSKLLADGSKSKVLALFYSLAPRVQFSLQYNAHGNYVNSIPVNQGNTRRKILNSNYVGANLQNFTTKYKINNLYRSNFVAVEVSTDVDNPSTIDNSRNLISEANVDISTKFTKTISSYYGALKVGLPSQYGQIDSIKQLMINNEIIPVEPIKNQKYKSPICFGGDVYINKFTEKNSMFFFNDWLFDQPDEFEYDYRLFTNVPYPRYWMDSTRINHTILNLASDFRRLDKLDTTNSGWKNPFFVKSGFFYLFNSGVREFFVESEVNLALRDWDDTDSKRHYDPYEYTDLTMMFRSDIIKSNNYYKYDYSLSNSRLFNSYISWGNVLGRDFDPLTAESCYSYYPKRVMYSLPQELELKKDNWKIFLPNNYKDLNGRVTAIKSINKTGALIMMNNESPIELMGVDQLQTDAGIKITLGDGGLFNQPLQNITNADKSYQFGSCQNRYAISSTPHGLFYVSQEQGKIFNYAGKLEEVSKNGNKYWFAKYLPSELLKDFPNYEYYDNPVIGIGCQVVYDNINEIVYFTKKDYKVRDEYKDLLIYTGANKFTIDGLAIPLGDAVYFEDASWTMSYDPKLKVWISHHDWHPTFMIPGKSHFMTVSTDSIWKHNSVCDSYCNFYGNNYPFEIEFISSTGQTVTTMRSVEYLLECYTYFNDCRDKFHVLDHNFDRAIVYNSEQISGVLKLNTSLKNDPLSLINYPIVNLNNIDILCSKEEHKYRFNQFWDITKDRGEFTGVQNPVFVTQANGYVNSINRRYVDYSKPALERKKFRHYSNRVFLRKLFSGNTQMIFKLVNTKTLTSIR